MSEQDPGVGNTDPNAGGKTEQMVSYESYDKLMKQRKADQEENRKIREELDAIKADRERQAQEKAQKDGDWQKVIEAKNQENASLKEKVGNLESELGNLNKSFDDATKLQAVADKLPGKLKKKEYFNFIDTSKIVTDPETGALLENSVEEVANNFIENYGELLDIKKGTTPPADGPNSTQAITKEQWKKMSLADKRKNLKYVVNK